MEAEHGESMTLCILDVPTQCFKYIYLPKLLGELKQAEDAPLNELLCFLQCT